MAKLRVLYDGPATGHQNMERDASLLATHRADAPPILRLYRWDPAAVSIGYNQDVADFAGDALTAAGYDLVKRPTGGRAILHADELTYAVIGTSPSTLFGDSLHDTYERINAALLVFLGDLGLNADVSDGESRREARGLVCFKSAGRHEIGVGGRKLIGSAQRRSGNVFLQHGSILTGPRHLDLAHYLKSGLAAADADSQLLFRTTTDLGQLLGTPQTPAMLDAMMPRLAAAFSRAWGMEVVGG